MLSWKGATLPAGRGPPRLLCVLPLHLRRGEHLQPILFSSCARQLPLRAQEIIRGCDPETCIAPPDSEERAEDTLLAADLHSMQHTPLKIADCTKPPRAKESLCFLPDSQEQLQYSQHTCMQQKLHTTAECPTALGANECPCVEPMHVC